MAVPPAGVDTQMPFNRIVDKGISFVCITYTIMVEPIILLLTVYGVEIANSSMPLPPLPKIPIKLPAMLLPLEEAS